MHRSFALLLASATALVAAESRSYEGKGTVVEIRTEKQGVVLKHEEIAGYMPAMTMPFRVSDPKLLGPLKPGDSITFRLRVAEKTQVIDQIKVISTGAPAAPPQQPMLLTALAIGDPLPDLPLTDERGAALKFSDYRGQAFAFTFIFTRCPAPDFCPLLSAKFGEVQRALLKDKAPNNSKLLSISIDPAHDTPEVLRKYATGVAADPGRWRFATADLRTITTLALQCGVNFWDESGQIVHNLRTIIVDPRGRIRRIYTDNKWTADDLVTELRAAAAVPSD